MTTGKKEKATRRSLETKPNPLEGQYIVLGHYDGYYYDSLTEENWADIPVLFKVVKGEYVLLSDLDLMAMNDYQTGEDYFIDLLHSLNIKKVFFIEPKRYPKKSLLFEDLLGGGEYDNGKGTSYFYATNSLRQKYDLAPHADWSKPLPEGFEVFIYNETSEIISKQDLQR